MGKAGSLLLLALALTTAPLATARAEHDRDGDHERGDRRREREWHGCGCRQISISSSAPTRERAERRDRFSARRTPSLRVELRLRTEGGDLHAVRFQFLTPKGHVYQEARAKYDEVAGGAPPGKRRHASASFELPVAGTFIATSSLFGRWKVVPYLDDDTEPCGDAAAFTITE